MKLGFVIILLVVFLGVDFTRAESGDSILVESIEVSESVGNMDGSLDAGESGLIEIVLGNNLGYKARAIDGTINTDRSDVSITDGYAYWGDIGNGSSRNSLPNHMGIQLLSENREAILFFVLAINWMDTEKNWHNITINLSMLVNHGYDVGIDTDGFHHDVTQPTIIKVEPVGKLDRKPVLGAKVTMSIVQPDRTKVGPILLRDDGEGVDEEAGDGLYTARYHVMTAFPIGIHKVSAEVIKNGFRGQSSASFKLSDPFLVWNKTYGGEGHDEAKSVVPSGDGGFVIAGHTSSFEAEYDDVYLVKVDSEGRKVWERTYGTGENDYVDAVVQSGDGGFVVAGYANCPLSASHHGPIESCDIYLLKVDAYGDKVWEKTYGGDRYEWAYCIARSEDGGFIVGGGLFRDVYVLKIDSEGNKVWEKTYGSSNDRAYAITESGDGGYVLTGFGNGEKDVYVLKIDSEGNKVWEKTYGGSDRDLGYGTAVTRSGEGFIVVGFISTYASPSWDLYLLGLDGYGNKSWEKIYSTTTRLSANDIIRSGDGFIVVGRLGERTYLLKIDSHGDKIWETTNPYCEEATAITEAGDGGFIVAGSDFYIAKIKGTPYIPIPELPFGIIWCLLLLLAIAVYVKRR